MKRRDFFKLAGISTTAFAIGALAGCDSPSITSYSDDANDSSSFVSAGIPISFSKETDVLIVGSGIAGLSAAMDPSEVGYSVIIADMLNLLGGESYYSNGLFYVAGTDIQKEAGASDDFDKAWESWRKTLEESGLTERLDFEKTLFEKGRDWVNRIVSDYGASFTDPKEYTDHGSPENFLIPKKGLGDLSSIMIPLRDKLTAQGVSFMLGMRAFVFILNEDNIPVGIRFYIEETNSVTDIKAKKIVFATGGFIGDQEMVKTYLPNQLGLACYTTYATGEGHKICRKIQGQYKGMEEKSPLTSDLPQINTWGLFGPIINVSPAGQRFAAEDTSAVTVKTCVTEEFGYWWTIFDNQLSDNGRSASIAYVKGHSPKRVIGPLESIEELAKAMSVSEETLKQSFDEYQKYVDGNKDEAFGKTLFLQSLKPPYYAVKQFPNRFRTFGGLLTDDNAQLLDGLGNPIANVYCCGACASGSYGGLTSHAAYGTIAGKSIVSALADEDVEGNSEESTTASSEEENSENSGLETDATTNQ